MSVRLLLGIACVLSMSSCGASAALDSNAALIAGTSDVDASRTTQVMPDLGGSEFAVSAAPLQECELSQVQVVPAALPAGSIDQARAERGTRGVGTTSSANLAIPALVTIGERWGQAPSLDRVLKDVHGQPIASRAAWALVYRGQAIQRPSAGPARPKLVTAWPNRELPRVAVFAAIIDARTGEFLMGWGCDPTVY